MSKTSLRIYFNGEEIEPLRRLDKTASFYFNVQDNELTLKNDYYYQANGTPSTQLTPSLTFNNIKNVDVIKFIFYNQQVSSGVRYVVPNNKSYTRVEYKSSSSERNYIILDNTLEDQYEDFSITQIDSETYEIIVRIADIINHNNATSPTSSSMLKLSFLNVQPSTTLQPYTTGLIKLDIERLSPYIDYDDSFVKNYSFSRTINANNELPNYGVYESDGQVEIIDRNHYIYERIKNNALNVTLTTDIWLNEGQIAKLVGCNAKYPFMEKIFSYDFNDYLSIFDQIKCSDVVFVQGQPNSMELTARELYDKLVEITKNYYDCNFERLSIETGYLLDDITFFDPRIVCNNLKEMWEQFLCATMCCMFVNENGSIEVQAYHKGQEDRIWQIGVDKQDQDVRLNLINNNIVSQVNSTYYKYNGNVEQLYSDYTTLKNDVGGNTVWFSQALAHDYTQGDFTHESINFVVKGVNTYTSSERTANYLIIELTINLRETLLGGFNQFFISQNVEREQGTIKESRTINTYYTIVFVDDIDTYNNITPSLTQNNIYILNTPDYGAYIRKAKLNLVYFNRDTSSYPQIDITTLSQIMQFNAELFEITINSIGESLPYKNSLTMQDSTLVTDRAKYQSQDLKDYLINTTKNLYQNGKKTISFTTHNYDFINTIGNAQIRREKGEILKVGDLIKLIGTSDLIFKITKILASYEGQFTLQIDAIEYDINN